MKALLFQGNRVVTSDEVADAVLGFVEALSLVGLRETLHIPVVIDGALSDCTISFGSEVAWAAVSVPGTSPDGFSGSAETAQLLRERTARMLQGTAGTILTGF